MIYKRIISRNKLTSVFSVKISTHGGHLGVHHWLTVLTLVEAKFNKNIMEREKKTGRDRELKGDKE